MKTTSISTRWPRRRHQRWIILGAAGWIAAQSLGSAGTPQAFQVGPETVSTLPKGKEADGIIGDFILRNDKVEALISDDAPRRRANMGTYYGAGGITPGCLYDLTPRGEDNDQITIFAPNNQRGRVSHVRVVKDGADGEAVVETVLNSAINHGVYKRHEYRIRNGWHGVLITTTLRNEGSTTFKDVAADHWTRFKETGSVGRIQWADAVDPADKAGYAFAWVKTGAADFSLDSIELAPGAELRFARFLAVGHSPAEAAGRLYRRLGPVGHVAAKISDKAGAPIATASMVIEVEGKKIMAYPDREGRIAFELPPGSYPATVGDIGRPDVPITLEVTANQPTRVEVKMDPASGIAFQIADSHGNDVPCKVQFHGVRGTKNPNLGPEDRAHGCVDQYHSETGAFQVNLPPGTYRVVITHGPEYTHLEETVEVAPGQTVSFKGFLERQVQTPGWISADFHNHSTPSGDNTCGTDDRIINLAAEQIEFAPTTEHNRLYDWRPHIERLGLAQQINTVVGIELTGSGAHLNSFPFDPDPYKQDGGAPVWKKDPRLNAITLRDWQGTNPNRWVQINHPDMVDDFIDRDGDGRIDGGFLGLGELVDGLETQNYSPSDLLYNAPFKIVVSHGKERVQYIREFIWLQLLNRGYRFWGVCVSDAHSVYGDGVGGWRTYIRSATDQPAELKWDEISRNAKAGHLVLTTGPFLEVQTQDGILPGGLARAAGDLKLRVKVQCTDWIDIDRVEVLVNGRPRKDLSYTRKSHPGWFADGVVKFDHTLTIPLSQDSHLIVVAYGDHFNLSKGFGTSPQSKLHPCAYNNPIFVDVDGGGFRANGDTLGFDLPAKHLSVNQVKAILESRHRGGS